MSAESPQSYDSRQRQWAALQSRQQSLYTYPHPPGDTSHHPPPTSAPHEHPPNVVPPSFDFSPSYDQLSQSSSLIPSPEQYPGADAPQPPYTPYHNPGHQQSPEDYFPSSHRTFEPAVPAMTNPSYSTSSVPSPYTSSHFPHQNGLIQAPDYHAPASLPTVAPPFSAPYPTSTPAVGNKRQRPEEPEDDDAGDGDPQRRGDPSNHR
jgi:hypothetical protein